MWNVCNVLPRWVNESFSYRVTKEKKIYRSYGYGSMMLWKMKMNSYWIHDNDMCVYVLVLEWMQAKVMSTMCIYSNHSSVYLRDDFDSVYVIPSSLSVCVLDHGEREKGRSLTHSLSSSSVLCM